MNAERSIKLSICIISLGDRNGQLCTLLAHLVAQPRSNECEIITLIDGGQERPGSKRNRIMDATRGEYVVCIDDDDGVASDYIPRILEAIDAGDPVDAILIDGICTPTVGPIVHFDYRIGDEYEEGEWLTDDQGRRTIWRSPGHLCPIKREIADTVRFPSPERGEDLAWSTKIRPLLKTSRRAKSLAHERMYFYRLDANKDIPQGRQVNHRDVFTPQYARASGPGSTVGYSQPYRKFLEGFIRSASATPCTNDRCSSLEHPEDLHCHAIKRILDLGCGDMNVMGNVELRDCEYTGVDVIPERIEQNRRLYAHRHDMEFLCRDFRRLSDIDTDLILCKDVLQHWSTGDIERWLCWLDERRAHFRYVLITNCNYGPTVNTDIETGGWRAIDLTKPPFEIGERVFQWGDEIGGYKDVVLIKGTK